MPKSYQTFVLYFELCAKIIPNNFQTHRNVYLYHSIFKLLVAITSGKGLESEEGSQRTWLNII